VSDAGHSQAPQLGRRETGTALDASAWDAAVVASLCLQHGAPVSVIRHALTRNTNGTRRNGQLDFYVRFRRISEAGGCGGLARRDANDPKPV
jgi:hypothetical protein